AHISGPLEWSRFCATMSEANAQKRRNVSGSTACDGYNLLGENALPAPPTNSYFVLAFVAS
ncbi:hypothetical protein, partial [Ketobacter nezhaii]|uniref:hypothetical protein n=1 Tax=Ketobacter sp. MCCC 1A13808 TaxID=2602738 RepID=UPI001E5C1C61